MYGETFYGRPTAQHQLQWRQIEIKMSSFKSNENILKFCHIPCLSSRLTSEFKNKSVTQVWRYVVHSFKQKTYGNATNVRKK